MSEMSQQNYDPHSQPMHEVSKWYESRKSELVGNKVRVIFGNHEANFNLSGNSLLSKLLSAISSRFLRVEITETLKTETIIDK